MSKKIIQNTFLTAITAAVLCAGTVSARQLKTTARIGTCSGSCSATKPCSGPCLCIILDGQTIGGCARDPFWRDPAKPLAR
jgi:hypothetical protein